MPLPKDPADELDLETQGDPASEGKPAAEPDPLAGKSVEELRALLKTEQERGQALTKRQTDLEAALKAERDQSSQLTYAALMAAGRGGGGGKSEVSAAPTPPDPEEDPKGYAEFIAERKAEEIFDKRFGAQLAKVDRTHALALSTAAAAGLAAARQLPRFTEVEPEVEAFLAQFPFEQRANPGAYEAAYFRILGKKHSDELREKAAKDAAPASAHARPTASPDLDAERPPTIPPLARKVAAQEGMKPKDWAAFSKRGMDIDDYLRHKAANGGK